MNNALLALDIAASLLTVSQRAMEGAQQLNLIISRARAEGRDVSEEELAVARAFREQADSEWKAALAKANSEQ